MPPAKQPAQGLVDAWGRRNRSLADRACPACSRPFRPARASSRFCSKPCARTINGGHNFKGESWWTSSKGYVVGRMWIDGAPRHVKRHRWLVEQHLGRRLEPHEDVHHVDGNKQNNDLSNLEVVSHAEHTRITNAGRVYRRGYRLNLSPDERRARSERMKAQRAQAAIAKATGSTADGASSASTSEPSDLARDEQP